MSVEKAFSHWILLQLCSVAVWPILCRPLSSLFLTLPTQVEHYWKHRIERDRVKWQRRLDSGRRGPGRAYHNPKEAAKRQFEKKQQHSKSKYKLNA